MTQNPEKNLGRCVKAAVKCGEVVSLQTETLLVEIRRVIQAMERQNQIAPSPHIQTLIDQALETEECLVTAMRQLDLGLHDVHKHS